MARGNIPFIAFSHGEIGREVMNRTTLEVYPHTASIMQNFMPDVTGMMHHRPGLGFVAGLGTGRQCLWRFQYSVSQVAAMVFQAGSLRIATAAGVIVRAPVSAALALDDTWTPDVDVSDDDGTQPSLPATGDAVGTGIRGDGSIQVPIIGDGGP